MGDQFGLRTPTPGHWGHEGPLPVTPPLGPQLVVMLSPGVLRDARGAPASPGVLLGWGQGWVGNVHTQGGSEEQPGWQAGWLKS